MSNESKSVTQNQFGETSISTLLPIGAADGPILELPTGVQVFSGEGAPTQEAPEASFYMRSDGANLNEFLYVNTDGATAWSAAALTGGSAGLATPLTGFVSGAGSVTASDTILTAFDKVVGNQALLQNGTFSPAAQTLTAAGAISTVLLQTNLSNSTGGSFAATLAAPSSQDGQLKILRCTVATNTFTLALTNVAMSGGYTPTGTTTMTFSVVGQSAVFMAVGAKWVYLGGSAVVS